MPSPSEASPSALWKLSAVTNGSIGPVAAAVVVVPERRLPVEPALDRHRRRHPAVGDEAARIGVQHQHARARQHAVVDEGAPSRGARRRGRPAREADRRQHRDVDGLSVGRAVAGLGDRNRARRRVTGERTLPFAGARALAALVDRVKEQLGPGGHPPDHRVDARERVGGGRAQRAVRAERDDGRRTPDARTAVAGGFGEQRPIVGGGQPLDVGDAGQRRQGVDVMRVEQLPELAFNGAASGAQARGEAFGLVVGEGAGGAKRQRRRADVDGDGEPGAGTVALQCGAAVVTPRRRGVGHLHVDPERAQGAGGWRGRRHRPDVDPGGHQRVRNLPEDGGVGATGSQATRPETPRGSDRCAIGDRCAGSARGTRPPAAARPADPPDGSAPA